jgi:hypothetical protein
VSNLTELVRAEIAVSEVGPERRHGIGQAARGKVCLRLKARRGKDWLKSLIGVGPRA